LGGSDYRHNPKPIPGALKNIHKSDHDSVPIIKEQEKLELGMLYPNK